MEGKARHELPVARAYAGEVVKILHPACRRIKVVGSLRRRRPWVHDIDLVLIPASQAELYKRLLELKGTIGVKGGKLIRMYTPAISIDIYLATPETWGTLLLIRTGSRSHNIKLCALAKLQGMKLHADGSGLTKNGDRIAGDTEESIFEALGLFYAPPQKREF